MAKATAMVSKAVTTLTSLVADRQPAQDLVHPVRLPGQQAVDFPQDLQVPEGVPRVITAPAEHLVGHDDQLPALGPQGLYPLEDGLPRRRSRPLGAVELVGGQVAHALQQDGAPPGQRDPGEAGVALDGLEALLGPHGPVAPDAGPALPVEGLHGGDVVPGQVPGGQHQAFGELALPAGRPAND